MESIIVKNKERLISLELLRIIAMFMVVAVHGMGNNTLYSAPQFSFSYYFLWLVEYISYIAVDIFFIITGYFSATQNLKIKKLLILEIRVFFYSAISCVLCIIVGYHSFNVKGIIKQVLPYLGGYYWYYTAYVSLMLLSPWINKLINVLDKRKHLALILLITGVSTLSVGDAFFTNDGYSVIWAVNLYLIGAFIRIYIKQLPSKRCALISAVLFIGFAYIWFVVIGRITTLFLGHEVYSTHFLSYRQFPIVLAAVFVFIAFIQVEIKSIRLRKVIPIIAQATFGIYLIHSSQIFSNFFWNDVICAKEYRNEWWYWIYVLAAILFVYIIALSIELLRNAIFSKLEKRLISDKFVVNFEAKLQATLTYTNNLFQ